jgi:hypothetical protein
MVSVVFAEALLSGQGNWLSSTSIGGFTLGFFLTDATINLAY